jgi:hypothetical protein
MAEDPPASVTAPMLWLLNACRALIVRLPLVRAIGTVLEMRVVLSFKPWLSNANTP